MWEIEQFITIRPDDTKVSGTFVDPRPRYTFTADGRWTDTTNGDAGRYIIGPKASPRTIEPSRPADASRGGPAVHLAGPFRIDSHSLTLTLTIQSAGAVYQSTMTLGRASKD